MNTPSNFSNQISGNFQQQFPGAQRYPVEKNNDRADRKNILLTPFLLSIPVIIILFSLISASSASELPGTTVAEPPHREVKVQHYPAENTLPADTIATFSAIRSMGLPAKK